MPFLNITYNGFVAGPNNTQVPAPPIQVLRDHGPVAQVTLFPPAQLAAQMQSAGRPIPAPVSGLALIDTGASMTCIDDAAAQSLGLPVINVIQMASASHASHPANVYPVLMQVTNFGGINVPMAAGAPLNAQGLVALIGRDLLATCQLTYIGFNGQITFDV